MLTKQPLLLAHYPQCQLRLSEALGNIAVEIVGKFEVSLPPVIVGAVEPDAAILRAKKHEGFIIRTESYTGNTGGCLCTKFSE